jgi:alpha-tubulin suppressor-like RCC1 family protein
MTLGLVASGGLGAAGALVACSAIIGVEDVRLMKDAGADVIVEIPPDDATPVDTGGGPTPVVNVLEVALGVSHTCARKPDLSVKCWGDDQRGQTGTGGTADGGLVTTPRAVGINDAVRIAAGNNHTCVVRGSGKVSCWGDNQDGQLGNGLTTRSAVPVDVTGLLDATSVACGASFSCAIRTGGRVVCWGAGLGGQLGNGQKPLQQLAPQPVSNLTDAVAISSGESHACALRATGTLVCWGDGVNGQLGNGDQLERLVPTAVPSLDTISAVAAGSRSTCALKASGAVFCWGANEIGQLGSGAANPTPNPSPTVVSGLDAIALWAGTNHACAVRRGGAVACWGQGFQGQLGDGQPRAAASTPTPSPTSVSGLTNAIGVGTGGNHSCAPTATGAILCWGANDRGQIGNGASGAALLSPESVLGYP